MLCVHEREALTGFLMREAADSWVSDRPAEETSYREVIAELHHFAQVLPALEPFDT